MSSFNRKKLKFLGISLATLTATTVTLVACGNEWLPVVMSQRTLEIIKLLIGIFLLKSVHWTFQRIQMLIQT